MDILVKTEDVVADMIASSSLSASVFTIYRGVGNDEKEAPCLIIVAESGEEFDFVDSGIHKVNLEFKVKEITADTSVTSSLASDIAEVFCASTTKNTLSGYSEYYCYDLIAKDSANSIDGDTRIQTRRFDVVCSHTT